MTVKEIEAKSPADMSANAWLREIALQLAALNEPAKPAERPRNK